MRSKLVVALSRVDALGVGFIAADPRQLDYNLSADDLARTKARLGDLRLRALAEHVFAAFQYVLGDLEADATPSAKLK